MRIPFVDLQTQYRTIKPQIDVAIQNILDNSSYILGKAVKDFEASFAKVQSADYCLGVSSGTDALHVILWSLGIGPGDEVITTPHTFIATAEAIHLIGARPVFVDIEESSFNLDVSKIESAITSRTKVILPVHLYGQTCDMDPILELAKRYGLWVVEDACQAHLAEYKGKKVGSIGIASAFSFYPGKNLGAYGEAGAVVTSDQDIYSKMYKIRDHGQAEKYYHDCLGHNYRMEGIQGAVLGVKLSFLKDWTEARRGNAQIYNGLLNNIPQIRPPLEMPYAKHVYHLYVIRTSQREELKAHLERKGVATGLHYPVPLHIQKAFQGLGYKKGDFPVTEAVAKEILSLPMYPELTHEQIEYVSESIKEFFSS